jgi:hypothetical protein
VIKQVQFFGKTASGVFCQSLFGSAGVFEKTAGAPAFADWETGDDLRKFIATITPAMRKENCYTLVNAMGAGEYFGANINSDYFPWMALAHKGEDYGFKTFLNANAFQHHKNKDPTRAFGKPVLSVLNHKMKRVELIVALNRQKAIIEGADGIITRIDAGDFPDVSMGCKVPFDVCSICSHKSKTKEDYCQHMRPPAELRTLFGPNRILPDGRMICVYNWHPRFFDISFVFIGADKTAKVMAKLASRGRSMICFGDVCAVPRLSSEVAELVDPDEAVESGADAPELAKIASAPCDCGCEGDCSSIDKLASVFDTKTAGRKMAEIVKEIPTSPFSTKKLPAIERLEPDLPAGVLDSMSAMPLSSLLSGTAGAGVVLKPREFQRIVLKRMGEDEMADTLDQKHQVFRPSDSFSDVGMEDNMAESVKAVLPLIMKYIHSRTAFGEPFKMRVVIMSQGGKIPLPTPSPVEHPLLDKISSAYNGYRRALLMKLSEATGVVEGDPELRKTILGDELVNSFSKTSSISEIASRDTVAYMMGAHLEDRSLLASANVAEAMAATNDGFLYEGFVA